MKKRYNSIFFDLDDTLLDYSNDELNAVYSVLNDHNLPCNPDILEFYKEFNDWQSFELGEEITAKTVICYHFKYLLKKLEITENTDTLIDEFFSIMQKSSKLNKGALKTLRYLKEKDYKIYITTNGFPEFQYNRIKKAKISKYLDYIFISEEIDLKKPSRAFFDYVLNFIGERDRSRVLIVGDAPTADIFGGINSKIDTCWFNAKDKSCRYKPNYTIKNLEELISML